MIVLALDTSTKHTAVALVDDAQVLGQQLEPSVNHSKTLLPAIKALLEENNLSQNQLQAIGVGIGPGSFTGVRIGVTVAKTLSYALAIPVVGVSSLRALANNGIGLAQTICPTIDALKNEIYCACYRVAGYDRMTWNRWIHPMHVIRDNLHKHVATSGRSVLLLGTGLLKYRQVFENALGDRLIQPHDSDQHQLRAVAIAHLAQARLDQGDLDDRIALEPEYCRLSEAELAKQRKKQEECGRKSSNGLWKLRLTSADPFGKECGTCDLVLRLGMD